MSASLTSMHSRTNVWHFHCKCKSAAEYLSRGSPRFSCFHTAHKQCKCIGLKANQVHTCKELKHHLQYCSFPLQCQRIMAARVTGGWVEEWGIQLWPKRWGFWFPPKKNKLAELSIRLPFLREQKSGLHSLLLSGWRYRSWKSGHPDLRRASFPRLAALLNESPISRSVQLYLIWLFCCCILVFFCTAADCTTIFAPICCFAFVVVFIVVSIVIMYTVYCVNFMWSQCCLLYQLVEGGKWEGEKWMQKFQTVSEGANHLRSKE